MSRTANGLLARLRMVDWARAVPLVLSTSVAAYSALFSWFTIQNHRTFHTFAYDLGIYMQSLWTTVNGHGFFYTSLWEGSRFAYHWEPVLIGVLPLYALFPHAQTLLVLQSVALGLGAVPVYLLARDELGKLAGLVFALGYLLHPAVHGVNSFDFHTTALAVPALLMSFYLFYRRSPIAAFILGVFALLCRENVAIVVAPLGLYWAWMWRRDDSLKFDRSKVAALGASFWPLLLCLVAFLWLVVSLNLLIPSFSPIDSYPAFRHYEGLFVGSLMPVSCDRLLYLYQLLAPLLFLPLVGIPGLAIGIPVFLQNVLSTDWHMYAIGWHYSALLIPGLFIAGISGVRTVLGDELRGTGYRKARVLALLLLASVSSGLLYSSSPISLGRQSFSYSLHHDVLNEAIEMIPPSASVYTHNDLFPHVCHRKEAYSMVMSVPKDFFEEYTRFGLDIVPWHHDGEYEYVLVDSTSEQSLLIQAPDTSIRRLYREYGIVAKGDGVFLFKRRFEGHPIDLLEVVGRR